MKESRNQEAKRLKAEGRTRKEIGALMGVGISTVDMLCRYQPSGSKRGRKPDIGKREEYLKLRATGKTLAEIGNIVGRTRQNVQQLISAAQPKKHEYPRLTVYHECSDGKVYKDETEALRHQLAIERATKPNPS